jgi:hypothetical protein
MSTLSRHRLPAFCVLTALPLAALAQSPPTVGAGQPVQVTGSFAGAQGDATDLSGVACAPADAFGSRLCLLVDDEGSTAQWATLSSGTLTPGATVALDGPIAPADTPTDCPGKVAKPAKQDADGEAVAFAAPYFYVMGSHGCSRKSGRYSGRAFRLYRIVAGATSADRSTDRIRTEIRAAPELSGNAERALDEVTNGATVEGIAAVGEELLIGFRAPSIGGSVPALWLNRTSIFDSQAPGRRSATLPLGAGRGVRDLAALPDGRVIVLAGPAQSQSGNYSLHLLDGRGAVVPIPGWSRPAQDGALKAEGVTVLSASENEAELLLVFEGAPSGAPEVVRVTLPRSTSR